MSFWKSLWTPTQKKWLIGIPVGAFVMFFLGIAFWITLDSKMEDTMTLEFCVSCHEMDTVYAEYKETIHYKNKSGVRAICSDCHVPSHPLGAKLLKKLGAVNELKHKMLGTIDTPEKFERHRSEMANAVWDYMHKTDSMTCRKCHSFDAMDLEKQDKKAQRKHSAEYLAKKKQTCIDCHQGIAHELPDDDEDESDDAESEEEGGAGNAAKTEDSAETKTEKGEE